MTRPITIALLLTVCLGATDHADTLTVTEEWAEYVAAVETETPEEAIERLGGAFPATAQQRMQLRMRRGQPFDTAQELLTTDPRMRNLRRAIARAEPALRQRLLDAIVAKLEAVLCERKQLDAVPEPGDAPSGIPLIILAAQYDRTGAALPVLLAWYDAELSEQGVVDGSEVHYIPPAVAAILERLEGNIDELHDASASMRLRMLHDFPMARRHEVMSTVRERLSEQPES